MAEVLSQSQIDLLLSTALSGTMDLQNTAEETPEKKYRKYDFYSPRKFTKDRIKMLNSVFDNYTRVINTRLNGLLHTSCEIEVESIEEQRYYEFSNALTEGNVLTLAYLELKEKIEETPVLIYLSTPVALSMMDRLMGGEGDIENDLSSEYSYTDLELQLYENIVKDLISVMGSSWESYLPLNFKYGRIESNPTLVQLMGLDETVVLVDIKIVFDNCEGRLSLCMPGMMLTNIFGEINRDSPDRRLSGENNSEEIFERLRSSELEIVAELGSTKLTLSDVYHLNVGDVIDLNQPKDTPVYLKIGRQNWFSGRIGTYNKCIAVKIGETFHVAEQRSELE